LATTPLHQFQHVGSGNISDELWVVEFDKQGLDSLPALVGIPKSFKAIQQGACTIKHTAVAEPTKVEHQL
jgi:hypothetical protein